jgi:hypothetical protein
MVTDTAERLRRVQRYSASLRSLFLFLFVLGAAVWMIVSIITLEGAIHPRPDPSIRIGNTEYSGGAVTGSLRAIGYVYASLTVAVALKLTFHLVRLFSLYADGKIFSAENVRQIRQIGVTVLLFPAAWIVGLVLPAILPAVGVTGAGGPPVFAQFVGSVQSVIFGLIVIIVSWIMDVGRQLREEQDLVV